VDPSFNTWKFWLSSAVFFTGVLIVGLIPGCAKGEELEYSYQSSSAARIEGSPRGSAPAKSPAPARRIR
jgi:hypothetical protein